MVDRRILHIKWSDASSQDGLITEDEFIDNIIIDTVGFLVRSTDKVVSIAGEITYDGKFVNVTHIPFQYIIERKEYA